MISDRIALYSKREGIYMKAVELSKAYDPKDFEDRIYSYWKEKGEFAPADSDKEHFSIVMPPPNVTGILHMGHALNNSLQDIIITSDVRTSGARSSSNVPGRSRRSTMTSSRASLRRWDAPVTGTTNASRWMKVFPALYARHSSHSMSVDSSIRESIL